jgi:hypothetical protein
MVYSTINQAPTSTRFGSLRGSENTAELMRCTGDAIQIQVADNAYVRLSVLGAYSSRPVG